MVTSRIAVLLLLLVCCRLPSNADIIHVLKSAKHPAVPATTAFVRPVAKAPEPEDKTAHAPSGAADDDRKSDSMTGDEEETAQQQQQQQQLDNDNEYGDQDASKRKWGKYRLAAWGKRRWSAANSKAAWGKRSGESHDDSDGHRHLAAWKKRQQEEATEKRRWSANNGMRAWGKRLRPYDDGRSKRSVGDVDYRWAPDKRRWRYGGPKRTWELNTMKTWGKRQAKWPYDVDDETNSPKRSWSSDNALRIWGKRLVSSPW